jgi:AhpD family alkylhydroperoxidase
MAAKISRFDIHDELTAPTESAPILKGALSGSGKLNNFVGVLAGSPAALRGYARMRSELRRGELPAATQERIALAVAEFRGSDYDVAVHARAGRAVGLDLDEIDSARQFTSRDER